MVKSFSHNTFFNPNSLDPNLARSTIFCLKKKIRQIAIITKKKNLPLLSQNPKHLLALNLYFINLRMMVMMNTSRSVRESSGSTSFLKIRKCLIGSFRLYHNRTVPSGINKEVIRIGYWKACYLEWLYSLVVVVGSLLNVFPR